MGVGVGRFPRFRCPSPHVARLVQGHPEHERARSVLEFAASGLAPIAVACTTPMQVARDLVHAGAEQDWAIERAREVAAVFRLVDVSGDDVGAAPACGLADVIGVTRADEQPDLLFGE